MPTPQTYSNHTRFHPPFHFFLVPVLIANIVITIVVLIRRWPHHIWTHTWLVVMAIALFLIAGLARHNPLRLQDRIIRLEENLRYQSILTPELAIAAQSLRLGQIHALRFASDAELSTLVQRTLTENLEPKAIKQSITNWRPDDLRV